MRTSLRRQCKMTDTTSTAKIDITAVNASGSAPRLRCARRREGSVGRTLRVADLVELAAAELARDEHARRLARAPAKGEHDGLLLPARDALLAQLDGVLAELESRVGRPCTRHEAVTSERNIIRSESRLPRLNVGDSTAALKRSNGTREKTWRRVSRPVSAGWVAPSGAVGVAGVEGVPKLTKLGSVTTRKLNTSSRRRCAYGPSTAVRMCWWCSTTGVEVPSEDDGVTESTKSSHAGSVSRLMDMRHISYA